MKIIKNSVLCLSLLAIVLSVNCSEVVTINEKPKGKLNFPALFNVVVEAFKYNYKTDNNNAEKCIKYGLKIRKKNVDLKICAIDNVALKNLKNLEILEYKEYKKRIKDINRIKEEAEWLEDWNSSLNETLKSRYNNFEKLPSNVKVIKKYNNVIEITISH